MPREDVRNENWNSGYRHANACSVKELIEKMNKRVMLHLFADSMQPDLLFREIETCVKISGDLMYTLIDKEIYRQFNYCSNVEEAETLRDKLAQNMERLIDYMDSASYQRMLARSDGEERVLLGKTQQSVFQLWDRISQLLYAQDDLQPEPAWTAAPPKTASKSMDPGWTRYEQKIEQEPVRMEKMEQPPQNLASSSAQPSSPVSVNPENTSGIPPIPDDQQPPAVQISQNGLNNIIVILSLALIIFGAISALTSILSLQDKSFLDILIYSDLWGLCIVNLIFVFVYYANKILMADTIQEQAEDQSVFEKYSFVFWADLIMLMVLAASLWLSFFGKDISGSWLGQAYNRMPGLFILLGTLILIYLFYRLIIWLKSRTYGKGETYSTARDEAKMVSQSISKGYSTTKDKWKQSRKKRSEKKAREKEKKEREKINLDIFDDDDDFFLG